MSLPVVELRATRPMLYKSDKVRTLEERQGHYPTGNSFIEAVSKTTSKYMGEPIDIQFSKGQMVHNGRLAESNEYIGTYIQLNEKSGPIKLPVVSHTVEGLKSLEAQPV